MQLEREYFTDDPEGLLNEAYAKRLKAFAEEIRQEIEARCSGRLDEIPILFKAFDMVVPVTHVEPPPLNSTIEIKIEGPHVERITITSAKYGIVKGTKWTAEDIANILKEMP